MNQAGVRPTSGDAQALFDLLGKNNFLCDSTQVEQLIHVDDEVPLQLP
jgi:hypothetical protein